MKARQTGRYVNVMMLYAAKGTCYSRWRPPFGLSGLDIHDLRCCSSGIGVSYQTLAGVAYHRHYRRLHADGRLLIFIPAMLDAVYAVLQDPTPGFVILLCSTMRAFVAVIDASGGTRGFRQPRLFQGIHTQGCPSWNLAYEPFHLYR